MNPSTFGSFQVVLLSAALLAAVGAIFGALMARVLWAEDLRHAQRIDKIRSQTEVHLRETIKYQDELIASYLSKPSKP